MIRQLIKIKLIENQRVSNRTKNGPTTREIKIKIKRERKRRRQVKMTRMRLVLKKKSKRTENLSLFSAMRIL